MKNEEIILRTAIAKGIITIEDVKNGNVPEFHTYDVWKNTGRIVKRGQRALFAARIWKFTEKSVILTAEQAEEMTAASIIEGQEYHEGQEIRKGQFILKNAYFFSREQTENAPAPAEIELPADCERTIEGRCEWITGNTREIKEQLKAAGYRFSRRRGSWYRFTESEEITTENVEIQEEPVQLGIFTDEGVNSPEPVTELNEGDRIRFLDNAFGINENDIKIVDSYDGFSLWFRDGEAIIGFLERDFEKIQKVA